MAHGSMERRVRNVDQQELSSNLQLYLCSSKISSPNEHKNNLSLESFLPIVRQAGLSSKPISFTVVYLLYEQSVHPIPPF